MSEAIGETSLRSQQTWQGWGLSVLLHGAIVGIVLTAMPKMTRLVETEPFKWDVALVERVQDVSSPEAPSQPQAAPPPQPVRSQPMRPVEPVSDETMPSVAPQQSVQMVHPVIEPVKPTEQKVDPPPQREQKLETPQPSAAPIEQQVVEAAKPKAEPVEQKAEQKTEPLREKREPLEQQIVETALSRVEPIEQKAEVRQPKAAPMVEVKQSEPVQQAESVMSQSQSVATAAVAEPVEARPQRDPATHTAAAPSQETPVHEAGKVPPAIDPLPTAPSPSHATSEAPVQVAKAMPQPQGVKADHRWIAESLGRRLAELKRYPSEARMNRLEGKVILKAVIRSDGHLADVSVQKSSGHSVLDEAAMEAVRLACPLHMKHDIGRPLIVVNVPMVYSLAN